MPPGGDEVDREAAEPVPAFVLLAGHRRQPGLSMRERRLAQRRDSPVARRQAPEHSLQRPGAREIEAIEMGELPVASVRDDSGLQPALCSIRRQRGQKISPIKLYPKMLYKVLYRIPERRGGSHGIV